jgi:hypothetical protein
MASKFESWFDFVRFEQSILSSFRYHFDDWVKAFMGTVIETSVVRTKTLGPETQLWRCQRSDEFEQISTVLNDSEEEPEDMAGPAQEPVTLQYPMAVPFKAERMKPLREGAFEGRVNPKGIPYLYLADDQNTAMSEMRPPKDSTLTLAEFRTVRNLKIVDCCHDIIQPIFNSDLAVENAEAVVWGLISYSFSKPVERKDNSADYAPTQVLGELFRRNGFDGIEFRSGLGKGHNFALFELDAAEVLGDPRLYVTKNVVHEFEPAAPMVRLNETTVSEIVPDPSLDF